MQASDAAGTHDILQNAVSLKHQVLAGVHLYLFAHKRVDEIQIGQPAVEESRNSLEHLTEGGGFDEDRMEDSVARVSIGVLLDTSAGERSVAYVHREEHIVHYRLPVHNQLSFLQLVQTKNNKQGKKVIDMVAADVVLERGCPLAGERVNAKAD